MGRKIVQLGFPERQQQLVISRNRTLFAKNFLTLQRGYVRRILVFWGYSVLKRIKSLLSAFTHTQNAPVKLRGLISNESLTIIIFW